MEKRAYCEWRTLYILRSFRNCQCLSEKIADYPFSIRVLLESLARHNELADLENLIAFDAKKPTGVVPFRPSRVVLQDFTGVPAVVDLAAMRDAVVKLGEILE